MGLHAALSLSTHSSLTAEATHGPKQFSQVVIHIQASSDGEGMYRCTASSEAAWTDWPMHASSAFAHHAEHVDS